MEVLVQRVAPTHDGRMGVSIRNSVVIFIAILTVPFRIVYTAVAFKHLISQCK